MEDILINKKRFRFLLSLITLAGISFGIEASAATLNDLSEVCQQRVVNKFRRDAQNLKTDGKNVKVKDGTIVNFSKINTDDQIHRTLYLAHAELEIIGAPEKDMTVIMYYRGYEADWTFWSECHFKKQAKTIIENSIAANERIDNILARSAQSAPEVRNAKKELALLNVIKGCTKNLSNRISVEAAIEGSQERLIQCVDAVQAGLKFGISTAMIYTSILEGALESKKDL